MNDMWETVAAFALGMLVLAAGAIRGRRSS